MKLMLVEDEPSAIRRYTNYLKEYKGNFELVAISSSFTDALEYFAQKKPDVIFSDIVIPGGSGLEFLQQIRDQGYTGKIVVVSGYDNFSYAQKAIRLGAYDYLLKPIFKSDYFAMLDKVSHSCTETSVVENEYYSENLPLHIRKAMKFIERNYDHDLLLGEVAQSAGVSPSYLSTSFSKTINMKFIDFVQYYRVKVASTYLQKVDLTLEDIAEKVGFCDAAYLHHCFKKITGLSPGKYRARIIQGTEA
jgi:two-component system response regulator YesN